MDQEPSTASKIGRWVGWLVVLALAAAVAVGTVAVVGQVTDRPLTRAVAAPSSAPTAAPVVATEQLLPTPTSGITGPLPDVVGRPVGEARSALEQAGAVVVVIDARIWDRSVQPDWRVCTAGETFLGEDVPTGEVHVAAVPAADPCP